ncbi:unnamed protein product [Adineta steineri]|uniref:Uncharacterized protein n=1 Tax=Adineta steineri TaxID=433720 RepID=A0A813WA39_9BILA|nr:unnamed protein product [Adineta steineri]
MVEYALAGDGAGELIDRDSYRTRQWPEHGSIDNIYKHCGCTVICKCSLHDDYTTHNFLVSDPFSSPSEVSSFRQQQEYNRPETSGNYILYQELLDRYPHYVLRGSSKSGDTFYRQKGSRFGYVPSYRVCSNELYNKQKQWTLKTPPSNPNLPPSTLPRSLALGDECSVNSKYERCEFPAIPSRRVSSAGGSKTRSFHRNNYFYDMAL